MATTTVATATATFETVDVKEARALFDEMIRTSGMIDTRVVLERDGVPIGAFVTAEDVRRLRRLDEEDAEFERVLAAMREPFKDVPPEEIEREALKALAEVDAERAERRARGEIV